MTYQETVAFLFQQLPMFHRIGASAYKKDLNNVRALMEFLNHPHTQYPTLHVAGTNGKGSTAHLLSAILQVSGRKTGLFVSPHYVDFRERIKIDGQYIRKDFVVAFTEQVRSLIETIHPSFFELTIAMALAYFAAEKVDVAVIEVGMGGRLDSTNIIRPELSVITNISFDHQQFLGNTLPLIAGEKAGIIKPGVPVVIGETHPETAPVFLDKARMENAPIVFADQNYRVQTLREDLTGTYFQVEKDHQVLEPEWYANLHGNYQEKNLQTLLQAVEWLPTAWQISEKTVRDGMRELKALTRFMGRWQILGQSPLLLCDSAHNEGGLQLAMDQLAKLPRAQLHLVIGMLGDKDLTKMLALLPQEAIYYFAKPDIPRGLAATSLQQQAAAQGRHGQVYPSVVEALRAARDQAQPADVIYVGGSTFVVAEVLAEWQPI